MNANAIASYEPSDMPSLPGLWLLQKAATRRCETDVTDQCFFMKDAFGISARRASAGECDECLSLLTKYSFSRKEVRWLGWREHRYCGESGSGRSSSRHLGKVRTGGRIPRGARYVLEDVSNGKSPALNVE